MGATNIPYCSKTWNPIVGCPGPLASVGCNSCWARDCHDKRHRAKLAGKRLPEMYARPFGEFQWFPERLAEPLRWRKPQRVFPCSQTDLFHADVSFECIAAVFGVMAACPQHLFLVVTKRIERVPKWLEWAHQFGELRSDTLMRLRSHANRLGGLNLEGAVHENGVDWPLQNVILVATACTQAELDRAAPILVELASQGWRTGLSLEPLLERVDLTATAHPKLREEEAKSAHFPCARLNVLTGHVTGPDDVLGGHVEWVTAGCESGPRARPCDAAWIRSVVEQCRAVGVRCFAKQIRFGKRVVTDPLLFPPDLNIRELPEMPR